MMHHVRPENPDNQCRVVARKLREFQLTSDRWPLVAPWPEVQQFELLEQQQEKARQGGTVVDDDGTTKERLPTAEQAQLVTIPWIETAWGAMRLYPLSAFEDDQPNLLSASIDFHLKYIRARPDETGDALEYFLEVAEDALGDIVEDGMHALSSGGVTFRGTQKQIGKKFEKFCQAVESGALESVMAMVEESLKSDGALDSIEDLMERGTCVDGFMRMRNADPALFLETETAANTLRATRSPKDVMNFRRVERKVSLSLADDYLMQYEASEQSRLLAAALDLAKARSKSMTGTEREAPWPEVIAAEQEDGSGKHMSGWTDNHWLQAPWGVLRLRFNGDEGGELVGTAQLLFRDARYDSMFEDMARIAAYTLSLRYPLLPIRWPKHGQPVFQLGVQGSLDEDLGHLAKMLRSCYVEDIFYSQLVRLSLGWGAINASKGEGFISAASQQLAPARHH